MATTIPASPTEQLHLPSPGVYDIRHGDAAPIREPRPLSYSGRLDTPRQFLTRKKALYTPDECTFVVDKSNNRVTFFGHEKATPTDEITGELKADPTLAEFKINTADHRWTPQALWEFLKVRGYFFNDAEEHKKILASLANFNFKVQRVAQGKHDESGNKREVYETIVKENSLATTAFNLKVPLFKGYDNKVFPVQMGFSPTDSSVSIFLYSDELIGLTYEEREYLLGIEEQYFLEFGCAVITKS